MIKHVITFHNGNVAVFDENGQQMPEYQDGSEETWKKICRDAPKSAEFEGRPRFRMRERDQE